MRKILILLLISSQVHSQSPETFASVDVAGYKFDSKEDQNTRLYYYVNPFFSQTFKSSSFGYFVEGWLDNDVYGLSPGLFFKNEFGKDLYLETGLGYGFEVVKVNSKKINGYINNYIYFENKAENFVSKNKIIINASSAFYPSENYFWYLGSATYFPIRNIGLGINFSSIAIGPRIQLSIDNPKVHKSIWISAGKRNISLGVQLVGDW